MKCALPSPVPMVRMPQLSTPLIAQSSLSPCITPSLCMQIKVSSIVHADQGVLATDLWDFRSDPIGQTKVVALPIAWKILRAACNRSVGSNDARTGYADERRKPAAFRVGLADELAQHISLIV